MRYSKLPFSLLGLFCISLLTGSLFAQDTAQAPDDSEVVFSGPQPGEVLPGFSMNRVNSENSAESVDVVKMAGQKPLLLIFFHERTRPAFGLMKALTKYAASKKSAEENSLTTGVCFLTKDPTEMTDWVNRITQHLNDGVVYGVYPDGIEGPGSLGLNRNVALTVLVAKEGKVTFNSALVQPSLETDGQKILAAIVEATGGGDVPDIRQLAGQTRMTPQRPDTNQEPNMRSWLAPVIRKGATNDEVDKAAKALEEHCAKDAAARAAVGRIANTVVNSGKLENYGTLQAQDYLKKWAQQYARPDRGSTDRREMKNDTDSDK